MNSCIKKCSWKGLLTNKQFHALALHPNKRSNKLILEITSLLLLVLRKPKKKEKIIHLILGSHKISNILRTRHYECKTKYLWMLWRSYIKWHDWPTNLVKFWYQFTSGFWT